jgi:archaellum component FlaC
MNIPFEEKVTVRLDSVTTRLDSMTTQLGSVTTRLESVTTQLESITKLIGKLATKEELLELAGTVSKLATKDELKETVDKAVDDLAGAVKKGFDEVHGKFAKINENFIKVGERFDILERKVERIDTKFTNQLDYFDLWYPTKYEFTNLDTRVKKIEKKLKVIS